jgi:hypothetical protein
MNLIRDKGVRAIHLGSEKRLMERASIPRDSLLTVICAADNGRADRMRRRRRPVYDTVFDKIETSRGSTLESTGPGNVGGKQQRWRLRKLGTSSGGLRN